MWCGWGGGGVEVEVLCSTYTQVTKKGLYVYHVVLLIEESFMYLIFFFKLRNKVKKNNYITSRTYL